MKRFFPEYLGAAMTVAGLTALAAVLIAGATGPVAWVASCHARTNARNTSTETTAARKVSEDVMARPSPRTCAGKQGRRKRL